VALGVTAVDYKKDSLEGAELEIVRDNSPAKKAGLKVGDIITQVGDKDVKVSRDLTTLIGKLRPGAKAKLTLLRDKKEMEIEVTLGSRPATRPRLPFGFPPRK
jgi:serine protease Do